MAGNSDPIWTRIGDVSANGTTTMPVALTTAAADYTGAGANNTLIFTADSATGGFVTKIRFKALGTNTASVARIFLNNGSANTTAANNAFFGEVTLPATTASAVVATVEIDYSLNIALPAGFRIYWGLGTTVAAGWIGTAVGGKY